MRCICRTILLLVVAVGGCERSGTEPPPPKDMPAAATNRIDVPPSVRQNLGITFARVERRPVRRTIRVPGEFELVPEARREHRAMAPGRVELLVRQFDRVEQGQPLAHLDSPQWRQQQHEAVEAEGAVKLARSELAIAEAQLTRAEGRAAFLRERLSRLNEAGLRRVELEGDLADVEGGLPILKAEHHAARIRQHEAEEHYASVLNVLASASGLPRAELMTPVETADGILPRWRTLDVLTYRAEVGGVVEHVRVSPGGWVETGGLILSVVDPWQVRFHADAAQSDLGLFHDGQAARIVPPTGAAVAIARPLDAVVRVGFEAHPQARTIPLYATPDQVTGWAKPGVTAFLEVFTAGDDEPQLAIPVAALVQDDLTLSFYRRDPRDPDCVYPVEADLGESDGRWVVVRSGVTDGDEVVLDGAYAIHLSGARPQAPPGYHYHADGSLHRDH